jgi:hypothetical protein
MDSTYISVKRGDTLRINFIWTEEISETPLNLTNCTARLHLKNARTKELLIDANTENGLLTVEGLTGLIQLNVTAEEMEDVPIGRHIFDLELTFTDGSVLSSETRTIEIIQDITT